MPASPLGWMLALMVHFAGMKDADPVGYFLLYPEKQPQAPPNREYPVPA
jgi:hypothetical protein